MHGCISISKHWAAVDCIAMLEFRELRSDATGAHSITLALGLAKSGAPNWNRRSAEHQGSRSRRARAPRFSQDVRVSSNANFPGR